MGAVYKARQKGLNRLVAVKILPPEGGRDSTFAERFSREAQALARLNHPHIIAVHDIGRNDGLYYLQMEYVEGVNLRQTMQAGGLSPADALAIVPQICDALQYAHDEGIVHRDIKPENILLDRRGRVKIADFGLAKLLGPSDADPTLTQTHQAMGAPRYMAPEQMEGARAVDHRADIYSLGVVFYELLTGELPLGRFAPPSQKVQIDVRLDEVVLRTLEKEPELRYQHASQVKTEVESIRAALSSKAPPSKGPVSHSPELPGKPLDGQSVRAATWRSYPKFVSLTVGTGLAIVYCGCLLFFFSFRGWQIKHGDGKAAHFQVGQPAPWFKLVSEPNGFEWSLHFLSSAWAVAALGLAALAVARRLEFWEKGRSHSMAWHYAIWGVCLAVVLGIGILSHVLNSLGQQGCRLSAVGFRL